MPTTCAYYLLKETETLDDDNFVGYFIEAGLGCAIRLRSEYYSHFHAHAFNHFTAIPYVMKDDTISFRNNGYNLIAWGPSNVLGVRRVHRGRELGIINDNEDGRNLRNQQRLDTFFDSKSSTSE